MTMPAIIALSTAAIGWITLIVGILRFRVDKRIGDADVQRSIADVGSTLVTTMETVLERVKREANEEVASLRARIDLLEGIVKTQQQQYLDALVAHGVEIAKKDAIIEGLRQQIADLIRRVVEIERHEGKTPSAPMTVTVSSP